jgi:hypothetical protein
MMQEVIDPEYATFTRDHLTLTNMELGAKIVQQQNGTDANEVLIQFLTDPTIRAWVAMMKERYDQYRFSHPEIQR